MPRSTHIPSHRAALAVITVATLLVPARPSGAQEAPSARHRWEVLASSGALVPTGAQRHALEVAPLSTAQLSYVVRSRFAVTTMLGWARSRDLAAAGDPRLSVFAYDLGVEARAPRERAGSAVTLTPFVGAGVGGRSYNHRDLDADATHRVAGYGALGVQLGVGRVHLRLEARDYVTRFGSLAGGGKVEARNDVMVLAGLRIAKRRARAA